MVSRELVAAEAHYHRSCYKNYTRIKDSKLDERSTDNSCSDPQLEYYASLESEAYDMLFTFIRDDLLENPKVVKMTDLKNRLLSYIKQLGIQEVKDSTKKHIRRKLEGEFGNLLQFEQLQDDKRQLIVYPDNLSRLQPARGNMELRDRQELLEKSADTGHVIKNAALHLRKSITYQDASTSWPRKPSELQGSAVDIPDCFYIQS